MQPRPPLSQDPDRESVWSISRRHQKAYFLIFAAMTLASLAYNLSYAATVNATSFNTALTTFTTHSAAAIITAAGSSIATIETGRFIMVMADMFREKFVVPMVEKRKQEQALKLQQALDQGLEQGLEQGLDQGLEQGRAQGHATSHDQWTAWNNRRLHAAANNLPFDEEPPSPPENNSPLH